MLTDNELYVTAASLFFIAAVMAAMLVQELRSQKLIGYKKVGGLRFVTIGRLQVSFCIKRAQVPTYWAG